MASRYLSVASVCLALMTSFGCMRGPLAWQRLTLNESITPEQVAFIQNGHTPLATVVERLGAPNELRPVGDQFVVRYHFTDGKYFRADFGWALRFFIPFSAPEGVLGGGGIGTNVFQVTCDATWVVQEQAFSTHLNSSQFRLWPF